MTDLDITRAQSKFRCQVCGSTQRVRVSDESYSISHCLRCQSWLDVPAMDAHDFHTLREALALLEQFTEDSSGRITWPEFVADVRDRFAEWDMAEVVAAAAMAAYGHTATDDPEGDEDPPFSV